MLHDNICTLISFILLNFVGYSQNFDPDISVNGINLNDTISVYNTYRDSIWNKLFEDKDERFKTILINRDKNQKAELIAHYGFYKNEFSEFTVSKSSDSIVKNNTNFLYSDIDVFITGKGVKLGMDKNTLKRKLGINFTEQFDSMGREI